MREVLEELISPTDIGKKHGVSAAVIRDWIKKAGHSLPKYYKRSANVFCNNFLVANHLTFKFRIC